jgi:hypothetical protein
MAKTELPFKPFNGMKFVDAWHRQWIFVAKDNTWQFDGYINDVPLADENTVGLLNSGSKRILDSIQEKGGGFGILTKFSFGMPGTLNSIITGDIILKSNSLDITCFDGNGVEIKRDCGRTVVQEATNPPILDFNFSDLLLDNICIEIKSGRGPKGFQGEKGDDGLDGTGDGPQGDKGDPGVDAVGVSELGNIIIEVDEESFYNTAVTNLELDSDNSVLSTTKNNMDVPDNDTPAEKVLASQLFRSIKFVGSGFEYELEKPADEDSKFLADPVTMFYPAGISTERLSELEDGVEVFRDRLSSTIDRYIEQYQELIEQYIVEYDKEIRDYIFNIYKDSKINIAQLVDRLADKEFSQMPEYCLGMTDNDKCDNKFFREFRDFNQVTMKTQVVPALETIASAISAVSSCICSGAEAAMVTGEENDLSVLPLSNDLRNIVDSELNSNLLDHNAFVSEFNNVSAFADSPIEINSDDPQNWNYYGFGGPGSLAPDGSGVGIARSQWNNAVDAGLSVGWDIEIKESVGGRSRPRVTVTDLWDYDSCFKEDINCCALPPSPSGYADLQYGIIVKDPDWGLPEQKCYKGEWYKAPLLIYPPGSTEPTEPPPDIDPPPIGDTVTDCTYAPTLLTLSGYVVNATSSLDCSSSAINPVGSFNITPGEQVLVQNSSGSPLIGSGIFIIRYQSGAIFDNNKPDCGYIVGTGTIDDGLVVNVLQGNNIVNTVSFPESSLITDVHQLSNVQKAYQTGPLIERAVAVILEKGQSLSIDFAGINRDSAFDRSRDSAISVTVSGCSGCV